MAAIWGSFRRSEKFWGSMTIHDLNPMDFSLGIWLTPVRKYPARWGGEFQHGISPKSLCSCKRSRTDTTTTTPSSTELIYSQVTNGSLRRFLCDRLNIIVSLNLKCVGLIICARQHQDSNTCNLLWIKKWFVKKGISTPQEICFLPQYSATTIYLEIMLYGNLDFFLFLQTKINQSEVYF